MLHDSSIGNLWPLTGQRLQNFKFTYAMNESLNAISALQAFSQKQDQAATVLKVNIAKLNPMGNEMNCNQAINIEVTFSCTGNSQLCFYNTQSKSDWQYCSIAS